MRALGATGLEVEAPVSVSPLGLPRPHDPIFGPRRPGLAEALHGSAHWTDSAPSSGFPGLDVIDGGESTVVSWDLFASGMFAAFCAEVREVYDAVVIDLPSPAAAPDAEAAARAIDGILDVDPSFGPPCAEDPLERLRAAGSHVLGVVRTVEVERRRRAVKRAA